MRFTGAHYSQEELAWIKANSSRKRADMHADFVRIFDRPDVTFNSLHMVRVRNGWTNKESKGWARPVYKEEFLNSWGYIIMRLPDGRRVFKHRHLWEAVNGPVPKGMMLKRKGDKLDTDPSNWELAPSGVLSFLSGNKRAKYEDMPDEIKPLMMTTATLKHQLRTVRAGPQPRAMR